MKLHTLALDCIRGTAQEWGRGYTIALLIGISICLKPGLMIRYTTRRYITVSKMQL